MILTVDKRIYNDNVISKVVYWMSGDYKIVRTALNEFTEKIDAIPNNPDTNAINQFENRFFQFLNDFKLRQIVADETRDIKTILYAKAFAEDEELTEEDIHD